MMGTLKCLAVIIPAVSCGLASALHLERLNPRLKRLDEPKKLVPVVLGGQTAEGVVIAVLSSYVS